MRESRTYGFVRGVSGDRHPYRNRQTFWFENSPSSETAVTVWHVLGVYDNQITKSLLGDAEILVRQVLDLTRLST